MCKFTELAQSRERFPTCHGAMLGERKRAVQRTAYTENKRRPEMLESQGSTACAAQASTLKAALA